MSVIAVSVVLPLFNRADVVTRAVESVRRQTFENWELIVVDDGSADDGPARVRAISDPRIRVLHHGVNRGPAAARNTGMDASRGTFVAFIDSDDEWLGDKLTLQYAVMTDHPGRPDITTTGFYYRKGGIEELRMPAAPCGWAKALLDGCRLAPGTTMMSRREVFDAIGPFDEQLGRLEDWDWLLRAVPRFQLQRLDEPLCVVNKATRADPVIVKAAVKRIRLLRGKAMSRTRGAGAVRRLNASLELEIANATFARFQILATLWHLFRMGIYSPSRAMKFARRSLVKTHDVLLQALFGRRGSVTRSDP